MKLRYSSCLIMAALLILSGCASVAPTYQPSMANVGTLKDQRPAKVKVGAFTADGPEKNKVNNLTIRGGGFTSPYNESYVEYLREALRQELSMAGLLADNTDVELSGVLFKNEFDASGLSLGYGIMEAQLTVKKDGAVRYDKKKSVRHEWESSFAGMIAIPKARENYAVVVQKLLASFYNDPEFQKALK